MVPLLAANLKMLLRDRQTLVWAVAFPVILVVVFGLFDVSDLGSADLGIVDLAGTEDSRLLRTDLEGLEYLDVRSDYASRSEAEADLEDGDLDYLLVIPESFAALGTPSSGGEGPVALPLLHGDVEDRSGRLAIEAIGGVVGRADQRLRDEPRAVEVEARMVDTHGAGYFDAVLIGLVGLGMMTNSMISIAVKISLYRNQSILKRLLATPLPVRNYFASEIVAHTLLSLVQAAVVIGIGVLAFDAGFRGNLLWVFLIAAFANTIFLNIGFVISSWSNSPRAASGLGNVVAIPMVFFSGAFFSTASLPSVLPELVQVLPLTPMLDAMRGVAIDGLQPWEVWRELAMLAGWLVVSSAAAVKLFRFG